MPIDQKRINGPEVSIPYQIYVDSSSKETEKRKNLLLKREDARKHSEIRKMCRLCFFFLFIYLSNCCLLQLRNLLNN